VKIIKIKNLEEAVAIFKKIGVDPYGIDAMASKTININILIENQPCKIANVIKQEMLSIGGDAAVARGSVSCSVPVSDILIMGTVKQILALAKKIEKQPFGLSLIARDMSEILVNISRNEYILKTSRRKLTLGNKTLIMGILNVTPDSFSDGGLFYSQQKAVEHGLQMAAEGANIIDIGGESTRPGAGFVATGVESKRVLPVIESLVKQVKIPISIDTKKAQVAKQALASGDAGFLDQWIGEAGLHRRHLLAEVYPSTGGLFRLRVHMADEPGVLAGITQVLGAERINIEDLEMQHVSPDRGGSLAIVIAGEGEARRAAKLLEAQGYGVVVSDIMEEDA